MDVNEDKYAGSSFGTASGFRSSSGADTTDTNKDKYAASSFGANNSASAVDMDKN